MTMVDAFNRVRPIPTPRPEKVATRDELNSLVADAYNKGWNEALDAAADAFNGTVKRQDFWDALDRLGWIRIPKATP